MRELLHADERGSDAGGGADELERALRVGVEAGEDLADEVRQVARELPLVDRSAAHDGDAERLGGFERGELLFLHHLIAAGQRLGHAEVERQLNDLEVVVVAAGGARDLDHLGEREIVFHRRVVAEGVPGGDAVHADFSRADRGLQRLEGLQQPPVELDRRDLRELRLRVVDVVDVDAVEVEIFAARLELVREIGRRHAVAAGRQVRRRGDAGLHERIDEIALDVGRRRAVEREVAALGRDDDAAPVEALLGEVAERRADGALAPLEAVVDRAVDHVAAELDAARDRAAVELVRRRVVVAEVGADADRGKPQAVRQPVVIARDAALKPLAVGGGALGGSPAG